MILKKIALQYEVTCDVCGCFLGAGWSVEQAIKDARSHQAHVVDRDVVRAYCACCLLDLESSSLDQQCACEFC